MRRAVLLAAHLVFIGFHLLSAVYCLLAYLPFTYHQIHAGHLLPWLDVFVRNQPLLNLAILPLALVLVLEPWRSGGLARVLAGGFAIAQLAYAAVLTVHPVLANLENNSTSLLWCAVSLGLAAGAPVAELACYRRQVRWVGRPAGYGASPFAATWGAIFIAAVYSIVSLLLRPEGLNSHELALTLAWSLLGQLVFFLGVSLVIELLASAAALFALPARIEFWLCQLLLAAFVTVVLRVVVWPAIGLTGWQGKVLAIGLGAVFALINSTIALWLLAGQAVSDGIAAAAAPATLGMTHSWRTAVSTLLIIAVAATWAAVRAAAFDWNFLIQKLTAAAVWLTTFGAFYGLGTRRKRPRTIAWIGVPLVFLGAYRGLEAAGPRTETLLESYGGYDASFLLVHQLLTPLKQNDDSFYRFLGRNTNIGAAVHVNPAPVNLVASLAAAQDPPNIFIITIDSLRRDYVSPYNTAVHFTPAMEAFAREGTVFQNAFTRYGGTGLSEPAIWSGSLLLHKQYVTPFAPMNALEKLIAADHYQEFLSRDSILNAILTPSAATVELDPPETTMSLDLERTLPELEKQIDQQHGTAQPIFAYTQPQNLHISVIQRQGATVPAGETYPGFYAPYASRVHKTDAAFGKFIEFLKARRLYDRSIIILTADHGDSLGEEGRWGHAYTLFPEIVRIPLIVHLPESLKGKVSSDSAGLAFSTDITPSLYYLLGHRPVQEHELFGAPLFTETAAERRRDPGAAYLLASSYGPVYGILSQGGRRLYVADGVNYRNYLFELSPKGAAQLPVASSQEQQQNELIREKIRGVDRFYGYRDEAGGSS